MLNNDLITVLVLLFGCICLFVWRRWRPDFVALFALVALVLSGVMTFQEAVAGFSDPIIIMIALMFVISEGLSRTGVSYRVGAWILKKSGDSVPRVIVFMMVSVAILGSVMSTTAVIAIFLPIALNMAMRLKVSPSKILMPLAYAGIISGLMTLVATTPNMIMNSFLEKETGKGFGFFAITPIGIIVLVLAVVYMFYAHKFLGNSKDSNKGAKSRKTLEDFARDYKLGGRESVFVVKKGSPLKDKSLKEVELRTKYYANVVSIERRQGRKREMINPLPDTVIHEGDVLFTDVSQKRHKLSIICDELGLEVRPLKGSYFMDHSMEVGMAEISVSPESEFIGRTLLDSDFRKRFGVHAVGMRRNGRPLRGNIPEIRMKVGDTILVVGLWKMIRRMHSQDIGFLVLSIPAELDDTATSPERAPYALMSIITMVVLMVSGVMVNALAALIACLMMIVFKCIDVEQAYKSIKWPTLILIVCMMPFAVALEKTGGVDLATRGLFDVCGMGGPHLVLAGLFVLTMFTGLFMSNTITAILIGPVAISAAEMLKVSPYPFAMTVAVAASTAFMSPLSTSVNMLVWEPGRYSFWDFMRIGFPFSIIVMVVSVIVIPLLFPFT